MKIKEIMKPAQTIGPSSTVRLAARIMNERRIGSLIVTDDGGRGGAILGIVTERDILQKVTVANRKPGAVKVKDIMTTNVVAISPEDHLDDAVYALIKQKIKKLPVTDTGTQDGELLGIVTSTDIVAHSSEVGARFLFE